VDFACEIAEVGADVIELGIPFSEPVADGPTIQAAGLRALRSGTTVEGVLECADRIRGRCSAPVVAMTYVNPVYRYGFARFAEDAARAGVAGTIVTDLPPEEATDWRAASRSAGLATVFLVTPASTEQRIRSAAAASTGFLYCVSRLGVTGERAELSPDTSVLLDHARAKSRAPLCVGFGISEPDHIRALSPHADGVVIGSALVSALASAVGPERHRVIRSLVRQWRSATVRDAI
jgi:tryptophan synthase alpha chain